MQKVGELHATPVSSPKVGADVAVVAVMSVHLPSLHCMSLPP
jgi:hypothetical protein